MPKTKIIVAALILIFLALIFFYPKLTGNVISSLQSPSTCSGQWSSCYNAFANDNVYTSASTSFGSKTTTWTNYNISVPSDSTIKKVIARADFLANRENGFINISVSNNGGSTYGKTHKIGGNTVEQTYLVDVTSDLSWTPSQFNNKQVNTKVTCFKGGSGKNPTCKLDWIPLEVQYELPNGTLIIANITNATGGGSPGNTTQPSTNLTYNGTCIDTDMGTLNFTTKGTTIGPDAYGGNTSRIASYTDSCSSGGMRLLEFSCLGNHPSYPGGYVTMTNLECPAGCWNGACITQGSDFDYYLRVFYPNPSSIVLAPGETKSTIVTTKLFFGNPLPIALSVVGCPIGATCTLNVLSGTPTFDANISIATTSATLPASYPVVVNGIGDSKVRNTTIVVFVKNATSTAVCTDSDDLNYTIKGVVLDGSVQATDYCSGGWPNLVYEQFCDPQWGHNQQPYNCTANNYKGCWDGKCF